MKRFLLLCLILVGGFSYSGMAKGNSFFLYGLKAGLQFPWQSLSGNKLLEDRNQQTFTTFQVGGLVMYQLPVPGLELEADLLFCEKGSRYKNRITKGDEFFRFYSLDIPLRLNYSIGLARTGIFLGAGPLFSVALAGKDTLKGESIKFGGDDDEYKRFDIALGVQTGLRFRGIQLALSYDWGFIDMANQPGFSQTNHWLALTLGYIF